MEQVDPLLQDIREQVENQELVDALLFALNARPWRLEWRYKEETHMRKTYKSGESWSVWSSFMEEGNARAAMAKYSAKKEHVDTEFRVVYTGIRL